MNSGKSTLKFLLGIITLDQIYLTITFPLITLIFFDPQSRLFTPDTSYADRSLWYGLCVALPNMINMFFAPCLTALSDEWGRKKIFSLEVFGAFLFITAVGFGIYWGILSLVFLGFIAKGTFARANPTALAMIGDIAPFSKKVLYMGYLQFAISIGACIGPFIGGYFAHRFFFTTLNFALPLVIAAILALINLGFVFFFLDETLKKTQSRRFISWKTFVPLLTQKKILYLSGFLFLLQLSWSLYYQFIPPILKTHYHFTADQLGIFIGVIAFWLALGASIGVRLLNQFFTTYQLLLLSLIFILFGLGLTLLPFVSFAWIGACPIAVGDVIAYSCLSALFSNAVTLEEQGKVMGIGFFVVSLSWGLTGLTGGYLMRFYYLLPLIIAPIGIILLFKLIITSKELNNDTNLERATAS